MRNLLYKFVDKIKTHIFTLNNFFENRALIEMMWKNIVDLDRT